MLMHCSIKAYRVTMYNITVFVRFYPLAATLNVTVEFVKEEFDTLLEDPDSTASQALKQKILANVSVPLACASKSSYLQGFCTFTFSTIYALSVENECW